ncbi:MAG: HepT-like ribonuclease domain-containing protein [Bacteroidia bacterium]
MSRSQIEYLRHILDETTYLLSSSESLSKEDFVEDENLKRAFTRSIEIMGEASKNLSEEIRTMYPQINWRGMARMRDKLIHQYFGVDYDLVWEVVSRAVPEIHSDLKKIIEEITD